MKTCILNDRLVMKPHTLVPFGPRLCGITLATIIHSRVLIMVLKLPPLRTRGMVGCEVFMVVAADSGTCQHSCLHCTAAWHCLALRGHRECYGDGDKHLLKPAMIVGIC